MPALACPGCQSELFLPETPAGGEECCPACGAALSSVGRGEDGTRYDGSPQTPPSAAVEATRYPGRPADPDATRYQAPRQEGDTDATRYAPPRDPDATGYTPTPSGSDADIPSGLLPRRFAGYELIGELGKGGMGVVYRARQVQPARDVALKMIRSGELATEADVRRFRQEADEAARLDHPAIVPIYEVGEHHGHHFYSMKLIDGGSLGNEHHETMWSEYFLGELLSARGNYPEAEKVLRHCCAAQRTTLGPHHLDVVFTLASLGEVLTDNGRPAEAEPLLRESVTALESGDFALAARKAGTLLLDHKNDGPLLLTLSRASNALMQDGRDFDPVWEPPGK